MVGRLRQESTSTNINSHSQATWPLTRPAPLPFPARVDMRANSTSRVEHVTRDRPDGGSAPSRAPEQRQPTRVALVGEHRDRAQLRDGLRHEHARQGRPAGEVTGEEPLVADEPPETLGRSPGTEFGDLVDEQERRPMREHVDRDAGARASLAERAEQVLGRVLRADTLYQASAILPFSSTRNAERTMPM